MLKKAKNFANIAYYGKKRRNGEPLINHTIRVANYIEKYANIHDEIILTAAILHEVMRKGDVTKEEIEMEFGDEVANIVGNLQQVSEIEIPIEQNKKTISQFHKLIIHLAKDIRVLIIRLADRIDNIKTANALPKEDQIWIAEKAFLIYAPISRSLGLKRFADILENEAFKIEDPPKYKEIKTFVDSKLNKAKKDLSHLEKTYKSYLDTLKIDYDISTRVKNAYSIYKKANRKYKKGDLSAPDAYEKLYDLLGMRVLVETVDACYKVLAFTTENYEQVLSEYDDYIKNPKPNGYKTLQTAIKLGDFTCEIQIRTFGMHEFNEFGPASHYNYKYTNSRTSANWIKDLINQKEKLQSGFSKENTLRVFENQVFVFTPKNDLVVLPKDSTVLDFAYYIHSDIGNRAIGATIDGNFVSLDTKLESGKTIDVVTSSQKSPSIDSLRYVKTTKAKRCIEKIVQKS